MISVIIPTYKSPDAFNLCLESAVRGQRSKNEIIVVVDGHYDVNKHVLEQWKEYIVVLNLEDNVGLCRGTNLGVYNASNQKVLIVNDDNVFPENWDILLEEVYQPNHVVTPNQIEPYNSMFHQFKIHDLGRDPKTFDLSTFWGYANTVSHPSTEESGSTLPIFMSKLDYLRVGGWDENYEMGMVADWDFFLKCQLSGMKMVRTYNCHFYHFVSLSTNTQETATRRREAEMAGHEYARYKWGTHIKHNPINNLKSI